MVYQEEKIHELNFWGLPAATTFRSSCSPNIKRSGRRVHNLFGKGRGYGREGWGDAGTDGLMEDWPGGGGTCRVWEVVTGFGEEGAGTQASRA